MRTASRVPVLLAVLIAVLAGAHGALAQPTNVRAWYAAGQVFVVWRFTAAPVNQYDSVQIYASATAQNNVGAMTKVGELFFPEYTGSRLDRLRAGARLLVPTPGGGGYRLAADEGVFAFTPRQAGSLFFAVVNRGSAIVAPGSGASAAFSYDPANDPVRPHEQLTGSTPGGQPYRAYVVWANGQPENLPARPDVPVLASPEKNGVPHVFVVTSPLVPPPLGPLACVLALHGGEGEYQLFLPGVPARAPLSLPLTNGVVVTPDDRIYNRVDTILEERGTSWFGYVSNLDPFFAGARAEPPAGSVVVNYTQRRVYWFMDLLLRGHLPWTVDPERVAVLGHSAGGRGASMLVRLRPELFAAAVYYTPAANLDIPPMPGQVDYLKGSWATNLDTNLPDAFGGGFFGVKDSFALTTRLSPTQRDLPVSRVFFGKRDDEGAAAWNAQTRAIVDALDDGRTGAMLFWDEREHGVEKWTIENAFPPEPDVGQWVFPVRTRRAGAQYMVDTYRASLSYPGVFNADFDPALAGQQPDPGDGDPNDGAPWGTWSGYTAWDNASIVDQPTAWEAVVYLEGLSTTSIDNAPVASLVADVVPRRVRNFVPPAGTPVTWTVRNATTNALLRSGSTIAEADGVVVAAGVTIPRDPARIRLRFEAPCAACRPDLNCDGELTFDDVQAFVGLYNATSPRADFNDDGEWTFDDIQLFVQQYNGGC